MLRPVVLVVAVGFILNPMSSFAYRPFATEDAGIAGKGVAQVEMSWDYIKWDNGDRENVPLFVPIYGITQNVELSLEVPYLFHTPEGGKNHNGLGDINLVGKVLMVEERDAYPAFTVKGVVKTDSGDEGKGLGSGDRDYSLVAVASKDLGDLAWHTMLGYIVVGDNGDENIRNIHLYGLAVDYGFTESSYIIAEVSGYRHPDRRSKEDPISGLFGTTYKVSDNVILDGAIRFGFNNSTPDWCVSTGTSLTF